LAQQNYIQNILDIIESNNTTLAALRQQAEAEKAGNRTGIFLPNPEIEFSYLWGSPAEIGNRKDLSVMQSFDFPTAYIYRRQIADGKATQADLQYAMQRKTLLHQTRKICIDLVYCNALKTELDNRLHNAEEIARAYQTKFDKGDANILEYNKAKLNLLNAQKTAENNNIERETLLAELTQLNGGISIALSDTEYETCLLPVEFEQWYSQTEAQNPELQYFAKAIEISRKQEQLNRAMKLPKFAAGYKSERVLGTTFQGIGVGISIPLWENKNTVKHAKAQTAALQYSETDAKMQFYNNLKTQYTKAQKLLQSADEYKQTLQTINSARLLQIALDKGQIALIDYMLELSIYYDAVNRTLETARDAQHAIAELKRVES
jgi:outer membrane protein TolC